MIKCDTTGNECKMSASGRTVDLLDELQTIIEGLIKRVDKHLVVLAIGAVLEDLDIHIHVAEWEDDAEDNYYDTDSFKAIEGGNE